MTLSIDFVERVMWQVGDLEFDEVMSLKYDHDSYETDRGLMMAPPTGNRVQRAKRMMDRGRRTGHRREA